MRTLALLVLKTSKFIMCSHGQEGLIRDFVRTYFMNGSLRCGEFNCSIKRLLT